MASSSKRPRSSKSKQGESSSKSNPLNLTRLLANDAQRKRTIFILSLDMNNIRVFYYNMNFRKNLMTSHVKGKDIVLDMKTFSSICCDIPMIGDITGFGLICEWDDYDRKKFYLSICRISKEEIERRNLLPYAIFITKILEHFGVSLYGETKVVLNLRESKVDIEVVHKMGFVIDHVTRRTYKHRTDRQPAPTDEPEPNAAPNQPESHAQSSTSAAMPTNQMIMDELVSLRGYITTRMDAFNTQSQQIHYELHRLSLRLSNMDVE
ncbi:hypothetical protein Lal_00022783 [Lupinus albus]|nr:hypothetical protein Lal_00022783 [Lupinus albus]